MSYTCFYAKGSCGVSPEFSLETYLDKLYDYIQENKNDLDSILLDELEGLDRKKVKKFFESYFNYNSNSNVLTIECDTESWNGSTDVWEFLVDSVVEDVMEDVMEVNNCFYDSRSGVDPSYYYITKRKKVYYPEDIMNLIQNNSLL